MIKFLDLQKINERFVCEINQKLSEIENVGFYLNGAKVAEFEENFATYVGTKHCVSCASGLSALELMINACDFSAKDEIIVPANTYIATIMAILHNNCVPVMVEPDINTFNIDADKIEEKITTKTRAILIVHLYGQAVQTDKIYKLADKYNLIVLEDSAQAHGAEFNGKKTGNLGNASAFSFYPSKNLGSWGNGGCVTTNDDLMAKKIRALANYGAEVRNNHIYDGTNSRLDEFQAAVLNTKLKYLDDDNSRRRAISKFYRENISNDLIKLPQTYDEKAHVWHIFPVLTDYRKQLISYLKDCGIETMIHYPIPPFKQAFMKDFSSLHLPITEKIHDSVLSIPISPVLNDEEVGYVVEKLNRFKI